MPTTQSKSGTAILMSNKLDFQIKEVIREKDKQYIMKKGIIHQEGTTVIDIYAPNIGAPIYIKQLLTVLKQHIN